MAHIKVVYHREQSSWWANSPEVPGFHVGGETLVETRHRVREGLPFFLGADQVCQRSSKIRPNSATEN